MDIMEQRRKENEERCRSFGSEPNALQWKWRHPELMPEKFDPRECEAALLDAFISQGQANVWCGDGSSCALQIVEAVYKKWCTSKPGLYTPDQQRAADYVVKATKGMLGAGEDPVGFLIASHQTLQAMYAATRESWVAAKEYAFVAEEGKRAVLTYIVVPGWPSFDTSEEVIEFIKSKNLPLGWVTKQHKDLFG